MKTLSSTFTILVLTLLLGSCVRNEVKLTFELSPDYNNPCRIVYYASDKRGGMVRETAVEIVGGKGQTVLPQLNPSLIYLFSPASKFPAAIIYGARGDDFVIKGEGDDVAAWQISGNSTTEELSDWRIGNQELLKDRDPEKLNKAVADYVNANPKSEAAAIILYIYFARRGHEKEFYELESKLDKTLTDNAELSAAISMADLFTGIPDSHDYPPEIILTGESGYADTLNISSGGNLLLMFRKSEHIATSITNDSLKNLIEKRKKDIVAEVYAEPDSFTWRRHLRDTVPGLRRLWLPMGVADSLAMKLGIRRMPVYVVLDKDGKELYFGSDWGAAIKKFDR